MEEWLWIHSRGQWASRTAGCDTWKFSMTVNRDNERLVLVQSLHPMEAVDANRSLSNAVVM